MIAKDIMTSNVLTVEPDISIAEAAQLLIEQRISGAPVVDSKGALIGILSEGDLVHRVKGDYELPRAWWLKLLGYADDEPREYLKSHGTKVADVMSSEVHTVPPTADISEMAEILESRKIKRLPVVEDGRLVGMVSRANIIQALVAGRAGDLPRPTRTDQEIRTELLAEIGDRAWFQSATVNVAVSDGVVRYWGSVASEDAREALRAAAENVPGVDVVETHLAVVAQYPAISTGYV